MKQRPRPKRPLRDGAIAYGILAGLVVLVAWATGAAVVPRTRSDGHFVLGALPVAVGFFVLCMAYSWLRFRKRPASEGESS